MERKKKLEYRNHVLLFRFFLLLQLITANPTSTATAGKPRGRSPGLVLQLRTQKFVSFPARQQPNKLLFRHNVTLAVTVAVGTPPQNVSMVLDTGSELSWLLCPSTTTTTTINASSSFNPRASRSYSSVPCVSQTCRSRSRDLPTPGTCDAAGLCSVSLSYADGSSSDGTLAADRFLLGDGELRRTAFACISSVSGDSSSAAAGLLGMNRGELSFVTQSGTRRFSYCISDLDASGILILGSLARRPPLNYTPMVETRLRLPYFDRSAYSVQLAGIRVGSVDLPVPESALLLDHTGAGQTMVDSGTQFTFLVGPAYQALRSEFLRQTSGVLRQLMEPDFVFQGAMDLCFLMSEAERASAARLPAVAMLFVGPAEVVVEGERLLYQVAGERRGGGDEEVWCLTFGNSDLVPMEASVIGHHHQQNVWVEYDIERSRVGFAPVRCDIASQKLGIVL